MANFSVKYGSKASYLALGTYDSNALYFCTDTKEIFKGSVLYTDPVRFVDEFPASPAQGVIYINSSTQEGRVYTGSEWKTVIKGFSTVVNADSTDNTVATSKAVYTAVNAVNADLSGVKTDVATLKGDENTDGSVAKALKDAKAYADGKDAAIQQAQTDATNAGTAAQNAMNKIGDVGEGTVADAMDELAETLRGEITDSVYDDTQVKADIKANKDAIEVLNGTGDGSVSKQVADAVASIVADAPEAYDTLVEISDWITSHAESASAMNTSILQNAADIEALEKLVGTLPEGAASTTVVDYINEVVTNADLSKYALASDLQAAVGRIATLEGTVATHGTDIEGLKTATSTNAGDIEALETLVGAIPEGATATTVVGYVDEKVTASALVWEEF